MPPRYPYQTEEDYYRIGRNPIYQDRSANDAVSLMGNIGNRQREQIRYHSENTANTISEIGGLWGNALSALPKQYNEGVKAHNENEQHHGEERQRVWTIEKEKAAAEREKQKAQLEAEENAFLNEKLPNGMTRREQTYMNKDGYKGQQNEWENAPTGDGTTRWQQNYNREADAKILDMDQRRALIKKYLTEEDMANRQMDLRIKELGFRMADSSADNRRADNEIYHERRRKMLEDVGSMFASAKKDPEKLKQAEETAKRLKLTPDEINLARGMGTSNAKPPSIDQTKAQTFASKALAADDIVKQLESKEQGYDPGSYGRVARDLPFTGGYFKSNQDRQYTQAQKEFIAAILRRESGGAITPDEFKEYGAIYFPQPGDEEPVREQKKIARKRATEALFKEAGDAADPSSVELYKLPPTGDRPLEGGKSSFAAPSTKPKYVKQNGQLFQLNEQTGKYDKVGK